MTAGTSGGGAGKKGGKAGKAQTGGGAGLQLDEDWVVEHAAMVERILPGGRRGQGPWPRMLAPQHADACCAPGWPRLRTARHGGVDTASVRRVGRSRLSRLRPLCRPGHRRLLRALPRGCLCGRGGRAGGAGGCRLQGALRRPRPALPAVAAHGLGHRRACAARGRPRAAAACRTQGGGRGRPDGHAAEPVRGRGEGRKGGEEQWFPAPWLWVWAGQRRVLRAPPRSAWPAACEGWVGLRSGPGHSLAGRPPGPAFFPPPSSLPHHPRCCWTGLSWT